MVKITPKDLQEYSKKLNNKNKPAFNFIPQDIACLSDYERHAKNHLDDNALAYISGASGDEITKNRNSLALETIQLKSRLLNKLPKLSTRIKLLNQNHQTPILLAPIAYQKLAHPQGEIATAQAAAAQQITMILSSLSSYLIEEVAQFREPTSYQWFQLYIQPELELTRKLIKKVENAGYSCIVFTADLPVNGLRNREHRSAFELPKNISAVNLKSSNQTVVASSNNDLRTLMANAPDWDTICWIKKQTDLPVIVKGVMCTEDAELAMKKGSDGIIVSNHGGRSLDCLPASIEVLPEIVEVVQKQIPILLDGGIIRGTDVFKAIALGASGVLLGRSYIYALSTAGALGVAHAIKILKDEFELAMALTGCQSVADIDLSRLHKPRS